MVSLRTKPAENSQNSLLKIVITFLTNWKTLITDRVHYQQFEDVKKDKALVRGLVLREEEGGAFNLHDLLQQHSCRFF
jgi:hypothetical protein